MSPHGQSWSWPDEAAEPIWYNDTDAFDPPVMLSESFLYFTSSRRIFATFPKLSTQPTLNLTLALWTIRFSHGMAWSGSGKIGTSSSNRSSSRKVGSHQ